MDFTDERYRGWPDNLITINFSCKGEVLCDALKSWHLAEQVAAQIIDDHEELTPDQIRFVLSRTDMNNLRREQRDREAASDGVLKLTKKDIEWLEKLKIKLND